MRMPEVMGIVAGGVLSAVEVHDRVANLLHAGAMQKAFALLSDDAGDDALLGEIVEDDGVRHILGVALLEEGPADGLAIGVGDMHGIEYLGVEIDTYLVGLQFHALVFNHALVGIYGEAK